MDENLVGYIVTRKTALDMIAYKLRANPWADQAKICREEGLDIDDLSDEEINYIERRIRHE